MGKCFERESRNSVINGHTGQGPCQVHFGTVCFLLPPGDSVILNTSTGSIQDANSSVLQSRDGKGRAQRGEETCLRSQSKFLHSPSFRD